MTTFEREAEFATGEVEDTSYELRPDAVVATVSPAPGPTAIGNTSQGLLFKGWYARADNQAGQVYIAGSGVGSWNAESTLFAYAGDDVDMLSLAFDPDALPVVAMQRGGRIWVRYYDGAVYQLTDLCVGESPALLLRAPDAQPWSVVYLFYERAGVVYYRLSDDAYATEHEAGATLAADQKVWRAVLGEYERMHLILSNRDLVDGTYSLSRISTDILGAACLQAVGYDERIDDGVDSLIVWRVDGSITTTCDISVDYLVVAAGGDAGGDASSGEDSILWASLLGAGLDPLVDTPPDEHWALGGGDGGTNDTNGHSGGSGGGGGARSPSNISMWTAGGQGSAPQGYKGGGGQSTWGLLSVRIACSGGGGGYGGGGGGGTCLQGSGVKPGSKGPTALVPGWNWYGPQGGKGASQISVDESTGSINGGGGSGGVRSGLGLLVPGGEYVPVVVGQSLTTAAAGKGGSGPGGQGITGLVALRIRRLDLDDADWATLSGGTEVIYWDGYKYHMFTATATLTMLTPGKFEVLAGGAGGGGGSGGGGGGGGDVRSVTSFIYEDENATVGTGGAGGSSGGAGANGGDTSLGDHVTAWGGGGGAGASGAANTRATGGGGGADGIAGGAGKAFRGYPGGDGAGFDLSAGGSAVSSGGGGGVGSEGAIGAELETQGDELTDNWEVPSTFGLQVAEQYILMTHPDNDAMLHNALAVLNVFVQVRVIAGTNQTVIGPMVRAQHPTSDPDETPIGVYAGMNPFADKIYMTTANVTYFCGTSDEHVGQLYCVDSLQECTFHPIDTFASLKRLADNYAVLNGVYDSAGIWCLHSPASGNAVGVCREIIICGGGTWAKHVLCGNMPSGGSLQVVDTLGAVVGSASEAGGEAKVDLSCYGNGTTGVQQRLPYDGFSGLVVRDSGGSQVASVNVSIYPGGEYDVDGTDVVVREDPGDSSSEPRPITGLLARSRFDELTPGPEHGDGGEGRALDAYWADALGAGDADGVAGGGGGGGAELYLAGLGGTGGGGAGSVDTAAPTAGTANTGGGGGGSGDVATAGAAGGSGFLAVRTFIPQPAGAEIPTSGLIVNHDAQLITGLDDGDVLTQWDDASGNLNHLAAVGSPVYRTAPGESLNGRPCVRTGLNNGFQYATAIMNGKTAGEVFAVIKNDLDPNPTSTLTGIWHFEPSNFRPAHPWTDSKIYEAWGRALLVTTTNPTADLTAMHLYNVSSKTNEWIIRINNALFYTTATNTPSFLTTAPLVGTSYATGVSNWYGGVWGQLIVYDRVLSAAERIAIVAYLNWHWSLGL